MRLLLDESVPARLRRALPGHEVRTVVEMGWSGVKNGRLLALAAGEFDAFITVDKNLAYQQNLATLPVAVVVLDAVSIELPALLPLVPRVEAALLSLKPCEYVRIDGAAAP
jgi:predicted nuclease of predicted toxin-antitoxin system